MKRLLYIPIVVLCIIACQPPDLAQQSAEELVVQALIRQDADTQWVEVKRVLDLDGLGSATPVSGAEVRIESINTLYEFTESSAAGRYFNLELVPNPMFEYSLFVDDGLRMAQAEATAPPLIQVSTDSPDEIGINPASTGNTVISSWWHHAEKYSTVVDLVLANDGTNTEIDFVGSGDFFDASYGLPIVDTVAHILDYDFSHFGNQTLKYHRISNDYADLFFYSPNELTISILELQDNISGGSGYFTIVMTDELSFTVFEE